MSVIQAYRFALDPSEVQVEALRSHCGGQRFAYNWGLGRVKANLAQREAERSYGMFETELTPTLNWSAYGLRKQWNAAKGEVAPWWGTNSKEAYASGLANLATALANWKTSKTGVRGRKRMRFPRFKSRPGRFTCTFSTGAFVLVDADRRHLKLPRIGVVRTHESTRKLARHVAAGRARIRTNSLHVLSGALIREFDTIVVEDLNVAGMLSNRRLARSIAMSVWASCGVNWTTRRAGRGGR